MVAYCLECDQESSIHNPSDPSEIHGITGDPANPMSLFNMVVKWTYAFWDAAQEGDLSKGATLFEWLILMAKSVPLGFTFLL